MARFTDLPPEIRNAIYTMLLTHSHALQILTRPLKTRWYNNRSPTMVCRQIRDESLPIYYATNTFVFSCVPHDFEWLRMVGVNTKFLRDIKFRDDAVDGPATGATELEYDLDLIRKPLRAPFFCQLDIVDPKSDVVLILETPKRVMRIQKDLLKKVIIKMVSILKEYGPCDVTITGKIDPLPLVIDLTDE